MQKQVKWINCFISTFLALLLFTGSLLTFPNVTLAETASANVENKPACNLNFSVQDIYVISAVAGSSVVSSSLGSITIGTATATTTALWGLVPLTTTVTAVAAPVAGIVAVGGLATYGGYKVIQYMNCQNNTQTAPSQS